MEFEAVIGLEVHAQLSTDTKIFCSCRARLPGGQSVADIAPNSNSCPICCGHPGTLPVLNKKAVEFAIRAGLATGCKIRQRNYFARKNYFYPDLPKGYQISQYDQPICEEGHLDIPVKDGASKRIRIQRIHMEEDAGKNVHHAGYSVVNLNRAGVPLIEIVSHPDLRTPEEAGAYLRALHAVVTYIDVCDGNMQEGNFRCDANVSVMPKGSKTFGTRAEIKNVNSFRFVEKAIEYEIARQIEVVKSGGKVVQETRMYDADKNVTYSMRSKEEAHDYRYFPDPDLIPVQVEEKWIEEIRRAMPKLPEQARQELVSLGLSEYDAGVITASKPMADAFSKTFEVALEKLKGIVAKEIAKPLANHFTGVIARTLNEQGKTFDQIQYYPAHVSEVLKLQLDNQLSSTAAKQVVGATFMADVSPAEYVEEHGLKQVSDVGALEPAIDKMIAAHPAQVAEYRSGKEKLIGFFVGQVMKETGGKANPGMLQEMIKKKLSK